MAKRVCPYCGASFTPNNKKQEYCSQPCSRHAAQGSGLAITSANSAWGKPRPDTPKLHTEVADGHIWHLCDILHIRTLVPPCGSSSMCYYPRSCPNAPPDKTRAHEDAFREDQSIPGLSAPDFTKYD